MSKEEYQKYIEQGIATRRNTYRGKELTLNDAFWTSIQNGTFDDIYVGDYIKKGTDESGKEITWLIADIDNYLGFGRVTKHHLTIIPASPLVNAQMNTSSTTEGGYINSKMYKETLPSVLSAYITPVFNGHIVNYNNLLSNQVTEGRSSHREEYTRNLDLMGEINVYGTMISASSLNDVGIDTQQYAIFRLNPKFINSDGKGNSFIYWLKDVVDSNTFTTISDYGTIYAHTSSIGLGGVRPRFLIG